MTSFALFVVGMCVSYFFKINFLFKKKKKKKKKIGIIIPHQITQKQYKHGWLKGGKKTKLKCHKNQQNESSFPHHAHIF